MIYVIMYLVAIVLANLSIYWFGTTFVFINAFFFIGLDLVARDKLHERWKNDKLFLKMLSLIFIGSAITILFSLGAWQIAIASFLAFLLAGITDTIFYQLLIKKHRMIKINGSNIPSALVDSFVFPTLAFGQLLPFVILGQFIAKVMGGLFWSLVITKFSKDD